MQVPYLILCSENDDLATFEVISNFFNRLKYLGGDVKLIKWSSSPHVGQYLDQLHIIAYGWAKEILHYKQKPCSSCCNFVLQDVTAYIKALCMLVFLVKKIVCRSHMNELNSI